MMNHSLQAAASQRSESTAHSSVNRTRYAAAESGRVGSCRHLLDGSEARAVVPGGEDHHVAAVLHLVDRLLRRLIMTIALPHVEQTFHPDHTEEGLIR